MNKGIVVYGSHYGASEKYAKEIARQLNFVCKSYREVPSLEEYEVVIYGGGVYAGGVTGLKKVMGAITEANTNVYVFVVGLSSKTEEVLRVVHETVRKVVSQDIVADDHIFYYRGNMDMKRLSLVHRVMMKMLIHVTKKTPENERTEDQNGMISLEHSAVDNIKLEDIQDLVSQISL